MMLNCGGCICLDTQVCVEECPSENEVGVRNNPVCVDEAISSQYANVEDDRSLQLVSQLNYCRAICSINEVQSMYF